LVNVANSKLTGFGLTAALLLLAWTPGCVRRDGRNSDCRWPAETGERRVDAGHLSADAELAEDLAIRYADARGLRTPYYVSGTDYDAARDRCMADLFGAIARTHGVPVNSVSGSLGQNRALIDTAEIVPFVLLFCWGASAATRMIWRKYPPAENGWLAGIVMLAFLSLVLAAGSTLLGEVWCWYAESYRIGNHHMSFRVQRLWWGQHRTGLFVTGFAVFSLMGAAAARRSIPTGSSNA
jgi:hypothetical protein